MKPEQAVLSTPWREDEENTYPRRTSLRIYVFKRVHSFLFNDDN